jgi:hypothetical protein
MKSLNLLRGFKRVCGAATALVAALIVLTVPAASFAQTCPFDNGGSTLENDGLVLTRYALGLRGTTMVANTSFAVGDVATIESNIACPACGLRVTDDNDGLGNPIFTVADATIISRKLAGFGGTALTNGISSLGTGSRNTPAAVQSFLLAGCGATGGTVTNVATGAGLTGGPITATGTVSLASSYSLPQSCAPGQVAKSNGAGAWSCGTDNVGTGPTFPSCFDGQLLRFGAGGSLSCASLPPAPVTVYLAGDSAALLISADDLPLIGFRVADIGSPSSPGSIKCSKPDCSGAITQQVFSSGGYAATYISGAIGADGFPVFSFYYGSSFGLGFVKCTSADCTPYPGNSVLDSASGVDLGKYTSIAVPADSRPVVSYYDQTNGNLKILKCGNTTCSSGNVATAVDTVGDVGQHTSIAIAADGNPIVSYQNVTAGTLRVLKCSIASCATGNAITTVDSVSGVGINTSIAVPADGLPIISYYDSTNGNLKVLKCATAGCTGASHTLTAVDAIGDVGRFSSIKVPADGLPIISYYDTTNTSLKVVKCGTASCSSGNTISTLDDTAGEFTSIGVPATGYPVIAYSSSTTGGLKVLKCTNSACAATP